jgi:hypothetical protein
MKRSLLFILSLATALLMGCASMGVPEAKTFEDKLAVATTSVTQVRKVALVLLEGNKISKADAQNVQNQADAAREGIALAVAIRTTDPAAAQTKLTTAIAVLRQLDAYLATRQGAKP